MSSLTRRENDVRILLSNQHAKLEDKYPGLGLPIRDDSDWNYRNGLCQYPIGAHPSCDGAFTDLLFVRELAMMSIMEQLTDKEDWHKKIFDDTIAAKWRKEALAIPDAEWAKLSIEKRSLEGIMDEKTIDYCIEELRQKAKYFEQSGIIPSLDAYASVAKSDTLVKPELHEALRNAFQKLKADQASSPDWHPNSGDMVQDLVHPSMYPLVYDRSRVYQDEVVGVNDAIEKWAGKGTVITEPPTVDGPYQFGSGGVGDLISRSYWSDKYQWLPANLAFQEDGSLKFTSYINNLHPNKYQAAYHAIEKLIETSLPMWDQCLTLMAGGTVKTGAGRLQPRIRVPGDPSDSNEDNWTPTPEECVKMDMEIDPDDFEDHTGIELDGDEDREYLDDSLRDYKWEKLRKPLIPEVSESDAIKYLPEEGTRLIDRYREFGLQVIVKIASIELTPEKPAFPAGGWHVEGMMNEHICATALYYLDCENVTSSNLSFRMQTDSYMNSDGDYSVGQDEYHWMQHVFGANFGVGNGSACLQNYGSVETKQGRLLAFPNVFHHRVSDFELVDPSKPGHRRFIALWLVDPTRRIISTANVPPQQMNWWVESAFGSSPKAQEQAFSKLPPDVLTLLKEQGHITSVVSKDGELPRELATMVKEHFVNDGGPLPMGVEEAKEHRLKLMEERSGHQQNAEGIWEGHSYSFCEH